MKLLTDTSLVRSSVSPVSILYSEKPLAVP
jgi:hypothetical protein